MRHYSRTGDFNTISW